MNGLAEVKEAVSEQDKPFIIAVSTIVLFGAEVAAAVYVAIAHPLADLSTLKEAMTATVGFVGVAVTHYLNSKKNGNGP